MQNTKTGHNKRNKEQIPPRYKNALQAIFHHATAHKLALIESFKVTDSSLWSTGVSGESSSTATVHSFAATHTIVSSTQSESL